MLLFQEETEETSEIAKKYNTPKYITVQRADKNKTACTWRYTVNGYQIVFCIQCFDSVVSAAGRSSAVQKN